MHAPADKPLAVYITGTLGDALISSPLFHQLRKRFPKKKIILVVESRAQRPMPDSILLPMGLADEVLEVKANAEGKISARSLWAAGLKLKQKRVSLVYLITSAIRSEKSIRRDAWVFRAAGLWKLKGFFGFDRKTTFPFKDELAQPTKHELSWRLQRWGSPFSEQDISSLIRETPLVLTDELKQHAAHVLEQQQLKAGQFVCVAPFSGMTSKNWNSQSWQHLFRELGQKTAFPIVLLGGGSDFNEANELAADSPRIVNLCGKLSPVESIAVLSLCRAYIGLDSALSHAASLLKIPSTVLFSGQSHPGQWEPLASKPDRLHIIKETVPCAGCRQSTCPVEGHPCMRMSVESVLSACHKLLQKP